MDDIVEVYALDVPLPPVRRGDLVFRLIGHLPPVAAWAVALENGALRPASWTVGAAAKDVPVVRRGSPWV